MTSTVSHSDTKLRCAEASVLAVQMNRHTHHMQWQNMSPLNLLGPNRERQAHCSLISLQILKKKIQHYKDAGLTVDSLLPLWSSPEERVSA